MMRTTAFRTKSAHTTSARAIISCAALVACGVFTSASAYADGSPPVCNPFTISVTLAPTNPTPYNIVGRVCGPHGPVVPIVQLLLHGSTYSHLYWDFPNQAQTYVTTASQAGFVTVNLD